MFDKKNFYINGEWIKPNSSEEIKVVDPATEENCAVITLGNKIDINMAVLFGLTYRFYVFLMLCLIKIQQFLLL